MEKGQALFIKEDINTKFIFCGVVYDTNDKQIFIYDNSNPRGYRKHIYEIEKLKKWINSGLVTFKKANSKQLEDKGE